MRLWGQIFSNKERQSRFLREYVWPNWDCGRRDINPTAKSFISGFKTYLVNNVSNHSMGANCEDDGAECLLSDLKLLLEPETPEDQVN